MSRTDRGRAVVRTLALALLLATGTARADSSGLDWLGIVYLWAADIGADFRDRSIGVDFDEVVDELEMGFQGHVEAQGDELGGFVDVSFMGVGDQQSRTGVDLNADVDMTAMDLALVYSPGTERMQGLEIYGGLRYIDTDARLVIDPVPPSPPDTVTGINKSYTDFLLGARYIAPLNNRWRATLTGDISGGDTDGTFSIGAYVGYRSGAHHFIAGYRHFEMQVEAAGGAERVTQTYTGPLVAYGYSF